MAGMARRIKIATIASALLVGAAALAPLASAAERDQLTIGISTYPPTLNPLLDSTVANSYVIGMAVRPLTADDADWRPVCLLCATLPTLENGKAVLESRPDGKRGIAVTFT